MYEKGYDKIFIFVIEEKELRYIVFYDVWRLLFVQMGEMCTLKIYSVVR